MRTFTPLRIRRRLDVEWGTPLSSVNGWGKTTYICSKCRQEKPVTEFYRARDTKRGHQSTCRVCCKAKVAAYQAKHRTKVRVYHREYSKQSFALRQANRREHACRTYGFTQARYEALLEAQGGGCAICGRRPMEVPHARGHRFAIDHDHVTGFVRGVLCAPCNGGLGSYQDNIERLEAAILYLRRWAEVQAGDGTNG